MACSNGWGAPGCWRMDQQVGIDWAWQALDGAITKEPLEGEGTGRNPTDRGKRGTKRSLLTDGHGIPLAITVDGANRHDNTMVQRTLAALPIVRPQRRTRSRSTSGWIKATMPQRSEHWSRPRAIRRTFRRGGEETAAQQRIPGYRARRWVVERTHAWRNRFRRLLIRWEKKVENDLAMLHFACAWITFCAAKVFG